MLILPCILNILLTILCIRSICLYGPPFSAAHKSSNKHRTFIALILISLCCATLGLGNCYYIFFAEKQLAAANSTPMNLTHAAVLHDTATRQTKEIIILLLTGFTSYLTSLYLDKK